MKKQKTKKISLIFTCLILFIILSVSCINSGKNAGNGKNSEMSGEKMVKTLPGDDILQRGENIYKELCLDCHQADGSGVPMMFPPLTESDFINGDHEKLIKLILDGMSGPVEIKGEQYNSIMPPQSDNMDDQQVSDLLNFLRNSFGNSADIITAEEVERVRK